VPLARRACALFRDAVSGRGLRLALSWASTILRKRENYRRAFDGFDAEKNGPLRRRQTPAPDAGSRHRQKTASRWRPSFPNAKAYLEIRRPPWAHSTTTLWQFTGGKVLAPPGPCI